MSKFGESKLGGGNFVKRNRYKLKDGDNIYRILPAMGDLAADGRYSVYHKVVFGFKTTDGKHRPFLSPQVVTKKGKDVTIEVQCAATNLIEMLKGELKAAKDAGNTEKAGQLAKLVGDFPVMGVYSLNNDHYINVLDRQANVGQLELGHKAKLALDAEIKRIRDTEGFDPLAPETGRYLNIRRTGRGLDTMVQVTVLKEKVDIGNGKKAEVDVEHVIDDALADRLLTQKDGKWVYKEAANLTLLFQTPTAAEVEEIVKSADILTGKSAAVDRILGKGKDTAEPAKEAANEPTVTATVVTSTAAPATTVTAPAAAPAPAAAAPAPAPTPTVVKETKAAAAAAPAANATKTTSEAMAAMSPDDFMKSMGINLS